MRERFHYDRIEKYLIKAELTTPMHIGSAQGGEQDILIHPVTGKPFIQSSSITGAIRDYYEKSFGESERLFGSHDGTGNDAVIKITDGEISAGGSSLIEFRPRVKINPESGTVATSVKKGSGKESGNKFDMEYVSAGAILSFSIYIFANDSTEANIGERLLSCLSAMQSGLIVFGGQKSNGCGNLQIQNVFYKRYDLKSADGRKAWIKDEPYGKDDSSRDLKDKISEISADIIRITVHANTEGSILVKGYQVEGFGEKAPDAVNIKNGKMEYIVPGSSVKGAVRARTEYILKCLKLGEGVLGQMFGDMDCGPGNVKFYDTVILPADRTNNEQISTRIHIDKFTGGVMNRALFKEKVVAGRMDLQIDIEKKGNQEQSAGVILMALRDLATGQFNLGGGYHIGRGFLEVADISVSKGTETAKIVFGDKKTVQDDTGLVKKCIKAVGKEA